MLGLPPNQTVQNILNVYLNSRNKTVQCENGVNSLQLS